MKKLLILFIPSLIFCGCSSEKRQTGSGMGISQKVVEKVLQEKYIFNSDSSYAAWQRATRDQITKGKQLFMQGINFYVNKKDAAGAAASFRESILYYPDYQTYTYLGNAYIDMGDSVKADSALAEYEMPDADRSYAQARLSALKKDSAQAISSLSEAFANGFVNKKRFEGDRIFDYLRAERGFVAVVVTYLQNDEKLKAMLFRSFLASAPDLQLPFLLEKDSVEIKDLEAMYRHEQINYDFAAFVSDMEDSRFSRDVSNTYYMVGKFRTENNIYGVLYKSVTVMADTLPPVEIKLVMFDSIGNTLDEKTFAYYSLPETLTTGSIDANGVISIKEQKMKWKKDPLDNGYAGNEYDGCDLVEEIKYRIGPDGKLVLGVDKDDVVKK